VTLVTRVRCHYTKLFWLCIHQY